MLARMGERSMARIRSSLRELSGPVLVGVAYYLGAEAAFLVGTLSDRIFAPFWPPNIILFCALLLAPRSHWWLYIAFAVPAHVVAESQVGMPPPQLVVAFVTNCLVAVLNALLVQRALKNPPWLNDFRKTLLYIFITAVGVPAVVALAGAYVRILDDQSSEYWLYVAQWYVSNALGALTFGPVLLAWLTDKPRLLPAISARRLEAFAVGVLLLASCAISLNLSSSAAGYGLLPAFLYLPLPFILWSAIRFGARGASAAILIITVVAIWHASRGASLFGANDPESSVLSLQLFLIGISIPILLLGSAIEQLRNAERGARELIGVFLHEHDQERREIAYNLHESAAQNLTAAMLTTQTLRSQLPQARQPDVDELQTLIRRTIDDLRRMSYLLYPPMLDEAGLSLALRSYADSYERLNGVKVDLLLPPESERFTAESELVLFRFAHEALGSLIASPSLRPLISMRRKHTDLGDSVVLVVAGDSPTPKIIKDNLLGIQERLRKIGGRMEYDVTDGKVALRAIMPVQLSALLSKRGV
jgi:integral membrane sensor domain MASE1